MVESPVRRSVKTSSIIGATDKGKNTLQRLQGFDLLPSVVDFGILREGYTYNFTVNLKNTGVDACSYRIKQPPPSTGLKVLYQPGAVSALNKSIKKSATKNETI